MLPSLKGTCVAALTAVLLCGCGELSMAAGITDYNAKNYREAIVHFNNVLRQNPDSSKAYLLRGHCLANIGERQKAAADYRQFLRLEPALPDGYYFLGFLHSEMGEMDKAIEQYKQALEINPEYFPAVYERSSALRSLGRDDEALKDLDLAVQLKPEGWVYHMRADTLVKLQRVEESLKDYDKAIAATPNDLELRTERAHVLYRRADYAAALADLEAAVENRGEVVYPLNYLAWFLATVPQASLRNGKRAKVLIDWALEQERVRPDKDFRRAAFDTKAAVLAELGDFQGAIAAQEHSIRLAQQLPVANLDEHKAHLASYKAGKPLVLGPDQQPTTLIK